MREYNNKQFNTTNKGVDEDGTYNESTREPGKL